MDLDLACTVKSGQVIISYIIKGVQAIPGTSGTA